MKKRNAIQTMLGVMVIGLASVSVAWAKPIEFNDAGFDYSDNGVDTAYVTLMKNEEGGLGIDFASSASDTTVATVNVEDEVSGYDTSDVTDAYWNASRFATSNASADTFSGVDLEESGLGFRLVTLVHEDQKFADVKAAYVAQLEALGFTITPESAVQTTEVFTIQSADETIRVIMSNQGDDTQVTFSLT
ncbi:MAG: hypothetical protein ACRCYY_17675 [Trueperaceae bacterium]